MDFSGFFKRSKKEVIRANQEQGREGERRVKVEYEMRGYNVERTGKGHDYKISKRDALSGRKESKVVEVKTGNSPLSPLQKKKKRQMGSRYVVERLQLNPFTRYAGSRFASNSSKTHLDAAPIWDSPKRNTEKKSKPTSIWSWGSKRKTETKPKKDTASIWSLGSTKRKTKKKSKPTSSLWGWGSTKRKTKKKSKSSVSSSWGWGDTPKRKTKKKSKPTSSSWGWGDTPKRKTKKKSKPTSSSWGWGDTPKRKTKKKSKPSAGSMWGSTPKRKGRKKAGSMWEL